MRLPRIAAGRSPPARRSRCRAPRSPRTRGAGSRRATSPVPLEYFQGVTTDRAPATSTSTGYRSASTAPTRCWPRRPGYESGIPVDVFLREGYNHIGDITWDKREGGRLLLPLECFLPFFGNTCKNGAIAVADPDTLQRRYYVKLDKTFIDKAMWAEVSPNGQLLWTSSGSGDDLLAYRVKDIAAAQRRARRPAAEAGARAGRRRATERHHGRRVLREAAAAWRGRTAGRSGSGRST